MALKPIKPSKQQRNNRKQEPQPLRQQLGEAWPFQTLPKVLPPGLRFKAKG